ncbi:MAG: sodium:alanine symporter, partial [Paracoccaceae bacterium]|nr:sodium:alanine symporter [Paracoccaceae bacterium]
MHRNINRAVLAATATLAATSPAVAQSIDETVNQLFASSTGWFVNFIFSPFPGTSFPWIVA